VAPWVPTVSWVDLAVGGALLVAYWLVAAAIHYGSDADLARLRRRSEVSPTLLSALVFVGTVLLWTAVVAGRPPGWGAVPALLVGLLLVAGGLYAVGRSLSTALRRLRTSDRDLVDVGEATEGPVELAGTAVPIEDTTMTPFEGVEALCYTAAAKERPTAATGFGDANRTDNWSSAWYERRSRPFWLRDETGRLAVFPEGADFKFERHVRSIGGSADPPDRILGLSVVDESFSLSERDRRYVERRLEPGDFVSVRGTARERDVGGGRSVLVVEDEESTFVVSHDSERAARAGVSRDVIREAVAGLLLTLVGYAALLFATGGL
jgi:hypothetical protein